MLGHVQQEANEVDLACRAVSDSQYARPFKFDTQQSSRCANMTCRMQHY